MTGQTSTATTAKVMALGQQLSTTTKTSKAATADAAATIAQIGMIKGDALIQATKVANDLGAALGKDGPAAEQLAHSLRNPSEGYLELAKAGVAFSDAQIAQIQSLQESGNLLGAQQALMDAVAASTEGAAEAAGNTLSGKLAILSNAFSNVGAAVGEVVAPAIKAGVDQLTAWVAGLDTAANRQALWDYTAKAAGFVANAIQAMQIAWKLAQTGAQAYFALAVSGFEKLVEGINYVIRAINKLGAGLKEIDTTNIKAFEAASWQAVEDKAKDAAKAMVEPWKGGQMVSAFKATKDEGVKAMDAIGKSAEKAAGGMKQLTDRQIEAQGEATKLIRDLQEQINTYGQAEYAKKADQLAAKGATSSQVDKVRKLGAQLEGKQLAQSLENPLEKFEREMKKLEQLRADGGIDDQTYQRQKTALGKDLMSAVPQVKGTAGGALQLGSQEARSAMLSYQTAGLNKPESAAERIADKQLSEQQMTNKWLRDLVKGTPSVAEFSGL
jgi:hypothetical protein